MPELKTIKEIYCITMSSNCQKWWKKSTSSKQFFISNNSYKI